VVWLFLDNLPGNRHTPRRNINTTAKIDGSCEGGDGIEFVHVLFPVALFQAMQVYHRVLPEVKGAIFEFIIRIFRLKHGAVSG
jgi:hypothetical protein